MIIDLLKSSQDNFFELLYLKTGRRFSPGSVYFDPPIPYEGPLSANTQIKIFAQPNNRYKNSATIYYNRLLINHHNDQLPYKTIIYEQGMTIDDVKQILYTDLRLIPSEVKINATAVPELDLTDDFLFTIEAMPHSLCYAGTLDIHINHGLTGRIKVRENGTIKVTELNKRIKIMEDGIIPLNIYSGDLDGLGPIIYPTNLRTTDGNLRGF